MTIHLPSRGRRALRLAMTFAVLAAFSGGAVAAARADDLQPAGSGELVARRPDGTAIGACPLQHTDVAAEICGLPRTGSPLLHRLSPRVDSIVGAPGSPVTLAVLNVNCAVPAGGLTA